MVDLQTLGWDDAWESTLRKEAGDALQPWRVAMEDRQSYTVVTRDGERIARVAGRFLQNNNPGQSLPKVGDWVALSQKAGARSPLPAAGGC
jgi:ribosome biogenesis GTPase / thiamine phosphate phosphatase